jgi:NAD(P)-dependent dehydrogenase (short-subunit alcohol dehydrogenase family)
VGAVAQDELERFGRHGGVALVTGGCGGIGSRSCGAFARVGARLAVAGRDGGLTACR